MFNSTVFNGQIFNVGAEDSASPVFAAVLRFNKVTIFAACTIHAAVMNMACAFVNAKGISNNVVTVASPMAMTGDLANVHALTGLYHVILDVPQYFSTPRLVNHVVVMGVDIAGRIVKGEARDDDINEEILLPYAESMIISTDDAQTVAENLLAKGRLDVERGSMQTLPNIGIEIWDPVKITDEGAIQAGAKYRVSGWESTFSPRTGKYFQKVRFTSL